MPLLTLETNRSKKSTEYQSNLSPREAKTDDSKLDLSVDRDRLIELEFEITHLKEYNENLATENYSLRSILKDYEETKTNEDYLLEQLDKASIKQEELEYQLDKSKIESSQSLKTISELNEEIKRLKRKNKQMENEVEMRTSHLETKVRLLEEALNKRNDDIKEIELSNEELIVLLEKWDQKLLKLDEDYRLEKIKSEKYEQELGLKVPNFEKIDIETIDGRISFMVNILEEYRKMLEDDSQFDQESKYICWLCP